MLNTKHKLKIVRALATLLLFAFGVGCNGFFVNPTLSSITISPPNPSLTVVNQTQQLTATGSYSDGTTQNLTGSSGTTWGSSDTAAVTVNGTGLIKAVSLTAASSVTITATNTSSSGAVSGTTTVCVGSTCTTSQTVSISPSTTSYSLSTTPVNTTIQYTAFVNGTAVSATWSSSDPGAIAFTNASTGAAEIAGQGTTTITATASSGTGTLFITVTQ